MICIFEYELILIILHGLSKEFDDIIDRVSRM
jgi:hypothetical protein